MKAWHEKDTSPPMPLETGTCGITICVDLPPCCPVSGNPRRGSKLTLNYQATRELIDVLTLTRWVRSFQGGAPTGTRTMEGMILDLAQACADHTRADVSAVADCVIDAGLAHSLTLRIECKATPR